MLTSINVGEDLLESLREKLLATVLSVKADTFLTGFLLDNSSDANIIECGSFVECFTNTV